MCPAEISGQGQCLEIPADYLEDRSRRTLGPLRILLECFQLGESLCTQVCDSLLQLRVEDIDEELVEKRGQRTHCYL